LQNLRSPQGGFYSAEDAESALDPAFPGNKEEGAYYLWTGAEIRSQLDKGAADIFEYHYGVEDTGNALHDPMNVFAGKNILYVAHPVEQTAMHFKKSPVEITAILAQARLKLDEERLKRPRPQLDDKIITAWNGLMISAFAKAHQVLKDENYLEAARNAARFVMSKLYNTQTGQLLRRYRDGDARFEGGLQDYAFVVQGLLDLYEASFDLQWLESAVGLTKKQVELFWDPVNGGFFDITGNDPTILLKTKEDYDGAEPTGNSITALNLLRLSQMTDNKEWRSLAERTISIVGNRASAHPEIAPQMLVALEWSLSTPKEIIIAGSRASRDTRTLIDEVHSRFIPDKILLLVDSGIPGDSITRFLPFTSEMKMLDGRATFYLCENYACRLPTSDPSVVAQLLENTLQR
jgi:hypothetical protein